MAKYTYTDVLSVLQEIVNERPNFVYMKSAFGRGNCYYNPVAFLKEARQFDPNDPRATNRCIIGELLYRLGIEYNPEWELVPAGKLTAQFGFSVKAQEFVNAVQHYQDAGLTWSGALKHGVSFIMGRGLNED